MSNPTAKTPVPPLYGKQTHLALHNFPITDQPAKAELIRAIIQIKKAAAHTHASCNELPTSITDAIIWACDELLSRDYTNQFPTASIQGGAGTSINMNVNEVIAALATQKAGVPIHPNDQVNRSQSTNDVNPSALRIALLALLPTLLHHLNELTEALDKQAQTHHRIKKLSRTHLQDALPCYISDELEAYRAIIEKHTERLASCSSSLSELNLGGTAIGNGINASQKYREQVYTALREITGIQTLRAANNLMALTSSQTDFVHFSMLLNLLFIDLSKIATDIRILSSGPHGGIGEITLETQQPGSSIMPGKINPVIPEYINQVYYAISGKTLTVEHAAEGAVLELGIMFPVLADAILASLKLAIAAVRQFTHSCIKSLSFNTTRCKEHLEHSTAYATLLTPQLGYDKVSECVHQAIQEKRTLREVIIAQHLLTEERFDQLTSI